MSRRVIMADPAWNKGDYTTAPEQGMRLWAAFLGSLAVQSRAGVNAQFFDNAAVPAWVQRLSDGWRRFDANDWIYQTWAYDAHNLGTTPGFNGDYLKALAAIKAKTLIMAAKEPRGGSLGGCAPHPGRAVRVDQPAGRDRSSRRGGRRARRERPHQR